MRRKLREGRRKSEGITITTRIVGTQIGSSSVWGAIRMAKQLNSGWKEMMPNVEITEETIALQFAGFIASQIKVIVNLRLVSVLMFLHDELWLGNDGSQCHAGILAYRTQRKR